MMKRIDGKAFFTRLRWIAGVPLVFALALCTVLWWPKSVSVRDVTVEFVRFETSDDGDEMDYAVLNVRNASSRKWVLLGAREWRPLKGGMFLALGRLATTRTRIESGRVARNYLGAGIVHTLKTNNFDQVAVPLPRMGEKGWVEIFCWTPPEARRALPRLVQQCWWRVHPPKTLWTWVRCEVPIQCGRERSYGKPLTPRVLSQDGNMPPSPP